jgi:hypothetical protein
LRPRPEVSLTTNGIGLARLAEPLRQAGLDRLKVSLDTLSPETFVTLAHRDGCPSHLREPPRTGASVERLAVIWRRAIAVELPGHCINDPAFLQPARPTSAIGG